MGRSAGISPIGWVGEDAPTGEELIWGSPLVEDAPPEEELVGDSFPWPAGDVSGIVSVPGALRQETDARCLDDGACENGSWGDACTELVGSRGCEWMRGCNA